MRCTLLLRASQPATIPALNSKAVQQMVFTVFLKAYQLLTDVGNQCILKGNIVLANSWSIKGNTFQ